MEYLIENHDEAFHIWKQAAVKNRTVVHIDAHSDLQKEESLNIASYLSHAINAGMLNKCYWVIPKPTFNHKILFTGQSKVLHL